MRSGEGVEMLGGGDGRPGYCRRSDGGLCPGTLSKL